MDLDFFYDLHYFPKTYINLCRKCKTQTVGRFLDNALQMYFLYDFPESRKYSWISFYLEYHSIKTYFLRV